MPTLCSIVLIYQLKTNLITPMFVFTWYNIYLLKQYAVVGCGVGETHMQHLCKNLTVVADHHRKELYRMFPCGSVEESHKKV